MKKPKPPAPARMKPVHKYENIALYRDEALRFAAAGYRVTKYDMIDGVLVRTVHEKVDPGSPK